ncbi:hypothetical protein OOT00_12880 [Desulfobotulus sp. H1]|uniref:Alginate export domain-containing protein n=1 Tax=Desulfobotulus pelophilus TaxID=2823377 RepID=A0ABT3NBN7_9BACT|nr:DUF1302 family protein [Desulfobotulus pelophilus]MCW7754879.1 hypothetical protein [Desulfobotulus pelophilus]
MAINIPGIKTCYRIVVSRLGSIPALILMFCLPLTVHGASLDEDDLDFTDLLGTSLPGSTEPLSSTGLRETFRFEGELRPSVWYPMQSPHDLQTTNRLDMLLEKHMGNTSFMTRFRLDYQDLDKDEGWKADVRELYLEHHWHLSQTFLSLSAGRKILHWGKGDEIRPMDRVSPEDMTSFLYYDKNERKTGITGLFMESSLPGGLRVEAFWSPLFVGNDMPDYGSYFTPARLEEFKEMGGRIRNSDEDWTWDGDASMGLKLAFPLRRADASLYAWRGKDPMPHLRVSAIHQIPLPYPPHALPLPAELSWVHSDAVVFGADMELTAGAYVFRMEGAWQTKGHYERVAFEDNLSLLNVFSEGIEEKQKGELLIGMDRNDLFFRNLFVNLQYMAVYIHDHEPYLESDAYTHGVSFTMKYSAFDSRFNTLWRVFTWLNSQDRQHQLEASWKPARNTLLTLGAFIYSGGDNHDTFGQFRDKDFAFLRASVIF